MTKKMIFPLIFGLSGVIVLLSLGVWQIQRLEWKQDVISKIYERRNGEPVSLSDNYKASSPETHNYLSVFLEGKIKENEAHVYAPQKSGLGYRIVSEFEWNKLSIMVDLGWIPKNKKNEIRPKGDARIVGYISYPDDHDDSFTPEPDIINNIWFSRFVPDMARQLKVKPFLVVAEQIQIKENGLWTDYQSVKPLPISLNIKNDHREYAITWFSLALVWFLMTIYLLWRIKQKTV